MVGKRTNVPARKNELIAEFRTIQDDLDNINIVKRVLIKEIIVNIISDTGCITYDDEIERINCAEKMSEITYKNFRDLKKEHFDFWTVFWFCIIFDATFVDAVSLLILFGYTYNRFGDFNVKILEILADQDYNIEYQERCKKIAEELNKS